MLSSDLVNYPTSTSVDKRLVSRKSWSGKRKTLTSTTTTPTLPPPTVTSTTTTTTIATTAASTTTLPTPLSTPATTSVTTPITTATTASTPTKEKNIRDIYTRNDQISNDPVKVKQKTAFEIDQLTQHNKLLMEAVKHQSKIHKEEMETLMAQHDAEILAAEEKYKRLHEEFENFLADMSPSLLHAQQQGGGGAGGASSSSVASGGQKSPRTRTSIGRQKSVENPKENLKERNEALLLLEKKNAPQLSTVGGVGGGGFDKKMKRKSWTRPKPEVQYSYNRPRGNTINSSTLSYSVAKKMSRAMNKSPFVNKNLPIERNLRTCGENTTNLKAEQWTRTKLFSFIDKHHLDRIRHAYDDGGGVDLSTSESFLSGAASSSGGTLAPSAAAAAVAAASSGLFEDPSWPRFVESGEEKPNIIVLESATVEQLLELVVTPEASPILLLWDYHFFLSSFLMVFESFITPQQFLTFLIKRYNEVPGTLCGEDLRLKMTIVRKVLLEWIKIDHADDFKDDLLKTMSEFVNNNMKGYFSRDFIRLEILLSANVQSRRNSSSSHCRITPPLSGLEDILPPESFEVPQKKVLNVLDVNPIELARQITLLDSYLLNKIHRNEFLKGKMFGKEKGRLSPNLVAFVEHGNRLSMWIKTEILKYNTVKLRSEAITFFLNVLTHLEQLRNYNSAVNLLSALHSSTITKLKKSWEFVPKKEKETLDWLTELMSNSSHYKNYRELLKSIENGQPTVPLMSVIFSDLFAIDENLSEHSITCESQINWRKMRLTAKCISEVKRFSPIYYNLRDVSAIQNLILNNECWTDDNITYEIAGILESEEFDNKDFEHLYTEPDLWEKYGLRERDWAIIMTGARTVTYEKGATIIERGSKIVNLFRIKSGRLTVMRDDEKIGTMTEGQVFGEVAVILKDKPISPEKIVAETDVELDQTLEDVVHNVCQGDEEISSRLHVEFARILAKRLKMNTLKLVPHLQLGNIVDTTKINHTSTISRVEVDYMDKKMCRRFGIDDEVVIQVLPCVWKKNKNTTSSSSSSTTSNVSSPGSLYVFQNYIGLVATSFGLKEREIVSFSTIVDITLEGEKTIDIITNAPMIFTCWNFQTASKTHDLLRSIWLAKTSPQQSTAVIPSRMSGQVSILDYLLEEDENKKSSKQSINLKPTKEDWDIILKGSRVVSFEENETVIKEGERVTQLFQIQSGLCKVVQKQHPGMIISYLDPEDKIFGERTFLDGGKSTTSVITIQPTRIVVIEAYFLNILVQYYPDLAGRFFHYLGATLARRSLKKRHQLY